jgi:cytochrome c oxidase subunit 3
MEIPYTVQARPDTGLFNAKVGIWLFLASEVMLFGALFSSYVLLRVGADAGNWPHGLLNIPIGAFNTTVLIVSSVTVVMAWASLKMNQFKRFRIYQTITVLCALGFLGIKTVEYNEKFHHYEVWMKDGTRHLGHIEGAGAFWKLQTLQQKNLESITLHPDRFHYSVPAREQARQIKEGTAPPKHPEAIKIAAADIKRLSAFVPGHSTYFAIYFTLTALHGLHVLGGAIVIGFLLGPGAKLWFTDPERFTNRIEVSGLFWHFVDLVWIFLFPILYLL